MIRDPKKKTWESRGRVWTVREKAEKEYVAPPGLVVGRILHLALACWASLFRASGAYAGVDWVCAALRF